MVEHSYLFNCYIQFVHTLVSKPAPRRKKIVYINVDACMSISRNINTSVIKCENVNVTSVNSSACRDRKTELVSAQWKKSRQSLNTRKQLGIIILP